jgi:hypothetical protein
MIYSYKELQIHLCMNGATLTGFYGNLAIQNTAIADVLLISMLDYGKFLNMLLNNGQFDNK